MAAWTKEIKAYRKFRDTGYEAMHDLRFPINRYLNRCIYDGLTTDTTEGIEEITHHVKTKVWPNTKKRLVSRMRFQVKRHSGNTSKRTKAVEGKLTQPFTGVRSKKATCAGRCRWACAMVEMRKGWSVLYAASLVQSTDVSEQAVLIYLKWKDQQNGSHHVWGGLVDGGRKKTI